MTTSELVTVCSFALNTHYGKKLSLDKILTTRQQTGIFCLIFVFSIATEKRISPSKQLLSRVNYHMLQYQKRCSAILNSFLSVTVSPYISHYITAHF